VLDARETFAGLTHVGGNDGEQFVVGEKGLNHTLVEEVVVAVDDVLERFDPFEVLGKTEPVFFNHFITHVVNEVLDKVDHSLVEEIGWGEKVERGFLGGHEGMPGAMELAFNGLAPEQKPEEHLVLRHVLFVENQRQWECAFVVEREVVEVLGVGFEEWFLQVVEVQFLWLLGFYAVHLFVDWQGFQSAADVVFEGVAVGRAGADEEFEEVLDFLL
jgi:hypothetical protein